jgi:hypothetical protein
MNCEHQWVVTDNDGLPSNELYNAKCIHCWETKVVWFPLPKLEELDVATTRDSTTNEYS